VCELSMWSHGALKTKSVTTDRFLRLLEQDQHTGSTDAGQHPSTTWEMSLATVLAQKERWRVNSSLSQHKAGLT
jgi:hypothetical protein